MARLRPPARPARAGPRGSPARRSLRSPRGARAAAAAGGCGSGAVRLTQRPPHRPALPRRRRKGGGSTAAPPPDPTGGLVSPPRCRIRGHRWQPPSGRRHRSSRRAAGPTQDRRAEGHSKGRRGIATARDPRSPRPIGARRCRPPQASSLPAAPPVPVPLPGAAARPFSTRRNGHAKRQASAFPAAGPYQPRSPPLPAWAHAAPCRAPAAVHLPAAGITAPPAAAPAAAAPGSGARLTRAQPGHQRGSPSPTDNRQ